MNKLLLKLKSKIMAFRDMFKDDNDINEKNVVGFASFAVMVIFVNCRYYYWIYGRTTTCKRIHI